MKRQTTGICNVSYQISDASTRKLGFPLLLAGLTRNLVLPAYFSA